jgi:type II secretory pathway pseudopilin PulG
VERGLHGQLSKLKQRKPEMKMLLKNRAQAQRGVTAVELIIVLAVLAAIIAGIAIVAQNLFRSNNVTREVSEISQMISKARSFYGTQGTSLGFANAQAISVGVVGPEKTNAAGAILSRPAGTVLGLGPATIGVANLGFTLQYGLAGVNQQDCSAIVSDLSSSADYALWSPAGGGAVQVVRAVDATAAVSAQATANAGGTNVAAVARPAAPVVTPLTTATILAACPAAANAGTLSLIYRL